MRTKVTAQKDNSSEKKTKVVPKRDRSTTEAKLIRAGTLVFAKYGYDAATTKLISTKSGVNESLIMRYFGGKEGLLLEILKRHFEKNRQTPLPYPPQETLTDEMILFLRHGYEKARTQNEMFRIMFLRASVDPNVRRKVQAIIPTGGPEHFIERVNILKDKKKAPPHLDPNLLALIGFQNLSTAFMSGLLFDDVKQKEIQVALEKLASITIAGLLKSK